MDVQSGNPASRQRAAEDRTLPCPPRHGSADGETGSDFHPCLYYNSAPGSGNLTLNVVECKP